MSEDKTNTISGIEQGRASFAYECAKEGSEKGFKKEYKSHVKKVPMLIKTNGLGATFAFVFSKSNKGDYKLIYDQIQKWLFVDDTKKLIPKDKIIDNDIAKTIINLESQIYRAVTIEVLAFFNWLRRFAEGLIEGEATDSK